jgi:predicted HAD superfamily Cof-like phosphohydrolase
MTALNFWDVGAFHERFGLRHLNGQDRGGPVEIDEELMEFRIGFLKEELDEFIEASETMDHAGMADALIDLVYVAMGTAHMFGYPWDKLWDDVQRANMSKERATEATQSARGTTYDVIKPAGWQPPRTAGILHDVGFEV